MRLTSSFWFASSLTLFASACGGVATYGDGEAGRGGGSSAGTTTNSTAGTATGTVTGTVTGTECVEPTDCVVFQPKCCPDSAYEVAQVIAIPRGEVDMKRQEACAAEGNPTCAYPGMGYIAGRLLATCEQGRCKVVDAVATGMTKCSNREDCFWVSPSRCGCAPAGVEDWHEVLVSDGEAYRRVACLSTANWSCGRENWPGAVENIGCWDGECVDLSWD